MTIRPFDWRDLPTLHRYRHQSVYLSSALVLTRGPLLVQGALLSFLAPAGGIFTSVCTDNGDGGSHLIGQVVHPAGAQVAQLTFLLPDLALDSPGLPPLLEHLSAQAVDRGAFRLLAEVDERSMAYEALRRSTFAIYARQRVWQIEGLPASDEPPESWQVASEQDLIPVRSLYNNLVPGLVQQVEPFPAERLHGMVCREGGDVLAYVEIKYGHRGVWVQPFVHPDAEDFVGRLLDLLRHVPQRRSRPVYLCIRSYNSWLEPALEDMGAEAGPRQAVMVKHLAVPQKAVRAFAMPALEGGHPEATAPIARSQTTQKDNNGNLCHSER